MHARADADAELADSLLGLYGRLAAAQRAGAAMGPADPGQLLPAVLLRRRANLAKGMPTKANSR